MSQQPEEPRVEPRSHPAHEDDNIVVTVAFGDHEHHLTRHGVRELIRQLESALERADWSRE